MTQEITQDTSVQSNLTGPFAYAAPSFWPALRSLFTVPSPIGEEETPARLFQMCGTYSIICMYGLERGEAVCSSDIQRLTGNLPSAISDHVRRLEQRGLIKKQRVPRRNTKNGVIALIPVIPVSA